MNNVTNTNETDLRMTFDSSRSTVSVSRAFWLGFPKQTGRALWMKGDKVVRVADASSEAHAKSMGAHSYEPPLTPNLRGPTGRSKAYTPSKAKEGKKMANKGVKPVDKLAA